MIDNKELRIGNWVRLKDSDHTFQVEFQDLATSDCRNIHPIAITAQVLERCGFKHGMVEGIASFNHDYDNELEEGDTHYWDLRIKESDICDGFTFSLVMWGKQNYYTFSYQNLRARIKYLHQLQNLHYALTGTEITYTK